MGAGQSSPAPPPPPPPPAPPLPVVTVPIQKSPVQEGASGLHYTGRLYTNQYPQLASDICNGATASVAQINDVYANGVSSPTLPIDDSTQRISQSALQGHVQNMIGQGLIPGQLGTIDAQMTADKAFYASVQQEYCFYETRYAAALNYFLTLIASPTPVDPGTVQAALNNTIALNRRLNSLLEIIAYVGNDRAQKVNARSKTIDTANASVNQKIQILQQQKDFLTQANVTEKTQEEMMRFSKEKNRAMNIQIMFFVALNVVALGTVMTVYSSIKPSA